MRSLKLSLDGRCALMRERQARLDCVSAKVTPVSKEKEAPLTVKEAAPLWGQSEKATRRYFANVHGVRIIGKPRRYDQKRKRWIRSYDSVLIPPSILDREILKTTKKAAA
jgi:hypothetical protein